MSCRATLTTNRSSSAITLAKAKVASTIPGWPCCDSIDGGSVTADGESVTACLPFGDQKDADRTGFALLVEEPGVSKKAAAADGELNLAGFYPVNDVRQLSRVVSGTEEDHGCLALGNSPPREVADMRTPPGLVTSRREGFPNFRGALRAFTARGHTPNCSSYSICWGTLLHQESQRRRFRGAAACRSKSRQRGGQRCVPRPTDGIGLGGA